MYTRQNVYAKGGDLSDPTLLYYALAVGEMMKLPLNDPLSWGFFAAIHGFKLNSWKQANLPTSPLPSKAVQDVYWQQCQHGSWYFLPWHRGYLLALEKILRDHIARLNGPADEWALPYWNYFDPNQNKLPPAFAAKTLDDGTPNPLYIAERYGLDGTGDNIYVPFDGTYGVNLQAMGDPDFTGTTGASPGFGGLDTGFAHGGANHGGIETQPHDYIHVIVGGPFANLHGLMTDPNKAGYDPIFWLHHANIDRLWQVWNLNPPPTQPIDPESGKNPSDPRWLGGPASYGQRAFAMPNLDGSTWNYTPGDVTDIESLGYTYTELTPQIPVVTPVARLAALGLTSVASATPKSAMPKAEQNVELVGANAAPVPLVGAEAHTTVQLDPGARAKVAASLTAPVPTAAAAAPVSVPDRVFLNLENVTADSDGVAFQVYVGLSADDAPAAHPELLAGNIGLFGVSDASQDDGEHGGHGITYVLEITKIVDALHLSQGFNLSQLGVRLVPVNPVPAEANVKVGRVSVYRQGL